MMKLRNSSYKTKILFFFITFSVFILLLLWLTQVVYLRYSYESFQIKNLDKIANSIKNTSPSNVSLVLEKTAYVNNICVEYYPNNSFSIKYNNLIPGCILNKDNNQEIQSLKEDFLNSKEESNSIRLLNKEYETRGYLYELKLNSGVVFLYSNLEDLSTANEVIRNQLIYLTIIVIVVASMISVFLARRLSEPINDLTIRAKKLGSGEPVEFPKYGAKEVDELANVLTHAEADMLRTNELQRDLMANVSHDLKTPLTLIRAYAEMVRDISYKDDKKREENCNIIIDESNRLTTLVQDILTLSRMQATADDIELSNFDLVQDINDILRRYEVIKETESYKFVCDMPSEAIVEADKSKLDQVIYNLINNAINYTGKDLTVYISVKKEKDTYKVSIRDTGKGIKTEDIDFIWNKYYKNDKNHKRNVVGTGLGLSIVKTILEKHGFKFGVKSSVGKGTTFYFNVKKVSKK